MFSLEQSPDSSYILAGQKSAQTGYDDIWLMKLDMHGDTLWTKTYGDPTLHERGYYALPTQNGGYIVSATRDIPNYSLNDMIFMKLDNNGNILWEKSYGGNASQSACVIRNTTEYGFIAAGHYIKTGGPRGMYILKLNYQGDTLWTKVYNQNALSFAKDIQQTNDQGYIACGRKRASDELNSDAWLVKISPQGIVEWEETYEKSNIDLS